MILKAALIIDKRTEQSVKYKKTLENDGITVFIAADSARALEIMNKFEPDLILISDSMDFNIKKEIKQIRILTYNTRPVIIALSKSSHIQDKIDILDAGADDFLSEPINSLEFKARITAHIRRNFENSLSDRTMLFDSKISYKMIKRTINSSAQWAVMLIDINNLENYRNIYGALASDKLLQACSALIRAAADADDYIGHLSNENFIFITKNEKAEKAAAYIINAFETAVSKFYSRRDSERGFVFMHGDDAAENKKRLAEINIGIITNEYTKYTDIKQVMNSLFYAHKLSKNREGSNYAVERPQIAAKNAVSDIETNNRILIMEPDDALSVLLEVSAGLMGFKAQILESYDEIYEAAKCFNPFLIILDAGSTDNMRGIETCRKLKFETPDFKPYIIFTTILHDKELVLNAGADLYLPKPYELSVITAWIKKFNEDFNS